MLYASSCIFCKHYMKLIKDHNLENKFTFIDIIRDTQLSDNVIGSKNTSLTVPCFFTMGDNKKPKIISSYFLKKFILKHGIPLPSLQMPSLQTSENFEG